MTSKTVEVVYKNKRTRTHYHVIDTTLLDGYLVITHDPKQMVSGKPTATYISNDVIAEFIVVDLED